MTYTLKDRWKQGQGVNCPPPDFSRNIKDQNLLLQKTWDYYSPSSDFQTFLRPCRISKCFATVQVQLNYFCMHKNNRTMGNINKGGNNVLAL